MPVYNVHLYREMRLFFVGVEATAHEEAAAIARDRMTEDADEIEDCDGQTLAALVDVVGDEQYKQSRMIDFKDERLSKAAPLLLEAARVAWCRSANHEKLTIQECNQLCAAITAATGRTS